MKINRGDSMPLNKQTLATILGVSLGILSGCGTITGLPAHGGGKRSIIEQELVSAAVRGALREINLSSLRGKTVFIELGMISDSGGGTFSGGKFSLGGLLAIGGLVAPATTTENLYQGYTATSSVVTLQNVAGTSNTNASDNIISSTTENSSSITDTNSSNISNSNSETTGVTNSVNHSTSTGANTNVTNTVNNSSTELGASTNTSNSTTDLGASTNYNISI